MRTSARSLLRADGCPRHCHCTRALSARGRRHLAARTSRRRRHRRASRSRSARSACRWSRRFHARRPRLSRSSRSTMRDAREMLALATLTRPGPFRADAHARPLHRHSRQRPLVAMAGERLQIDEFIEISAVCTHPDYRGRGYGAALMTTVGATHPGRRRNALPARLCRQHGAIALYSSSASSRAAKSCTPCGAKPDGWAPRAAAPYAADAGRSLSASVLVGVLAFTAQRCAALTRALIAWDAAVAAYLAHSSRCKPAASRHST